jgi:hypothetical protein
MEAKRVEGNEQGYGSSVDYCGLLEGERRRCEEPLLLE